MKKTFILCTKMMFALASCTTSDVETETNGLQKANEAFTITINKAQTAGEEPADIEAMICGGVRINFQMSGVTKVELESVDGYALAGTVVARWDKQEQLTTETPTDTSSIVTLTAPDAAGLVSGRDYYLFTLPCNVYGGYRLSIYKDGKVAHYFGVHQTIEQGRFISPTDLVESELEFDDPDAPLVEEERPELDATTKRLLTQYQKNPTDENEQALLLQMGIRYDKVVARKKAKLRELEREAKT